MKVMDSLSGLGANPRDTRRYREDLQRRHGGEDALSCFDAFGLQYQRPRWLARSQFLAQGGGRNSEPLPVFGHRAPGAFDALLLEHF